jgi:hypothetical protein
MERYPWLIPVLSILSFIVSVCAFFLSLRVHRVNRILNRMDLQPHLYIKTTFNSDQRTAAVRIGNNGPVAAIQLTIQFESHTYGGRGETVGFGSWDKDNVIGTLAPFEEKLLEGCRWSEGLDRSHDRRRIREIRVTYRRESDYKLYIERALYFYNAKGEWVSEASFSPSTSEEADMVRAVRSLPAEPPEGFHSDPLHRSQA